MPNVKLPSADWNTITMILEDLAAQGYLVKPLLADINAQLDRQEN